jgi:hypothetical protein
MGVRLIVVAIVSQSAVLVGARFIQTGEVRDPLAPYAAILPGQPAENLEPFSCSWYAQYYPDNTRAVCRTNSEGFPSTTVSVLVEHQAIQSLTFDVYGFTVGDLARFWGRPIIGNYRGLYSVRWYRAGCVIAAPLSRRFSYRRPVRYFFVQSDQTSLS